MITLFTIALFYNTELIKYNCFSEVFALLRALFDLCFFKWIVIMDWKKELKEG